MDRIHRWYPTEPLYVPLLSHYAILQTEPHVNGRAYEFHVPILTIVRKTIDFGRLMGYNGM